MKTQAELAAEIGKPMAAAMFVPLEGKSVFALAEAMFFAAADASKFEYDHESWVSMPAFVKRQWLGHATKRIQTELGGAA